MRVVVKPPRLAFTATRLAVHREQSHIAVPSAQVGSDCTAYCLGQTAGDRRSCSGWLSGALARCVNTVEPDCKGRAQSDPTQSKRTAVHHRLPLPNTDWESLPASNSAACPSGRAPVLTLCAQQAHRVVRLGNSTAKHRVRSARSQSTPAFTTLSPPGHFCPPLDDTGGPP